MPQLAAYELGINSASANANKKKCLLLNILLFNLLPSPIFLIPALIVLPIELLFAFVFHDMFFSIMTNTMFAGIVTSYPLVFTLFQYLPIISFGFSVILIVITFIK